MEQATIETADGERVSVEGGMISEFDGTVYVFTEDATLATALTDDAGTEKYHGATIISKDE